MQTREIREYAERRGWTVAAEYVDGGISGTKEKREVLDRLMADAHRRKFDVVAVWKFDRFPRSVSYPLLAQKPIAVCVRERGGLTCPWQIGFLRSLQNPATPR